MCSGIVANSLFCTIGAERRTLFFFFCCLFNDVAKEAFIFFNMIILLVGTDTSIVISEYTIFCCRNCTVAVAPLAFSNDDEII